MSAAALRLAGDRFRSLLAAVCLVTLVAGCTTAADQPPAEIPAQRQLDDKADLVYPIDVYDPLEGLNRRVYLFNAQFDKLVFLPIVGAYETVTPEFLQDGISNFFTNILNLTTFANQVLQLKPVEAGQTAFRFAFNATFGLLGFIDIATALDVPEKEEDFGQTLGFWGVGEGPYLVLPILGPSNLRDAAGLAADTVAFTLVDPFHAASLQSDYPPVFALNAIDTRRKLTFRYYETGSPFEYDLVRFLYTRKRQLDIGR